MLNHSRHLFLKLSLVLISVLYSVSATANLDLYKKETTTTSQAIKIADVNSTARLTDYAVGYAVYLPYGIDGEQLITTFIAPDGTVYKVIRTYDALNDRWCFDSGSCWQSGWSLSHRIIIPNAVTDESKLGEWQFKFESSYTIYEENFKIVTPRLYEKDGNGSIGITNFAISPPFVTQLMDVDGVTPVVGQSVTFSITEAPRRHTARLTKTSPATASGRIQVTVLTDAYGYAKAYIYLGDKGGNYTITAESLFAPLDKILFSVRAVDVFSDAEKPEENLGEEDDEKACGDSSKGLAANISNPINIVTGNKFQRETDKSAIYPSPLEFTRYYNSKDARVNSLGNSWRHTFNRSIKVTSASKGGKVINAVLVSGADGRGYEYTAVDTKWVTSPGVTHTLEKTPEGWIFRKNNTIEAYDNDGRLLTITTENTITTTLAYHPISGLLERVDGPMGGYITFTYDGNNNLETITDQSAKQWTYIYDTQNNLSSVQNPDLTTKTYHYEDVNFIHALTGITDERQIRYSTYQYNLEGKARNSSHAGNVNKIDVTYQSDGSRIVKNGRGFDTTFTTLINQGKGLVTSVSGPGCSACSTGNGGAVSSEYYLGTNKVYSETKNNVKTILGGYGQTTNPGYIVEAAGTSHELVKYIDYDPRFVNKPVSIKSLDVVDPILSYNEEFQYDVNGKTIYHKTEKTTDASSQRIVTYQYNAPLNQVSRVDGSRTDVLDIVDYFYYSNDVLQGNNRGRLRQVKTPIGIVRDDIQYNASGKITSESRSNGVVVTYEYYPGNERLQFITQSSVSKSYVTHLTYLATGELETVTRAYGTPDAESITLGYDNARRVTSITDNVGNKIKYTLDTEGNKENEEVYDSNNVLQFSTEQTFDEFNKLNIWSKGIQVKDYDYSPDGTLDQVTDGKGTITKFTYDDVLRLETMTKDFGGLEPSTANALFSYEYNNHGNIKRIRDPNDLIYDRFFNIFGELLSEPSKKSHRDEAGNISETIGALHTYDASNRIATSTATGIYATGTDFNVLYQYDDCLNGLGRLCRVQIGNGTGALATDYGYDALGNIIQHQGIIYSYDDAKRVKTMTYPSGAIVSYTYASNGVVSKVTYENAGLITVLADAISYAPQGPMTALIYGNGLTLSQPVNASYQYKSHVVPGALNITNILYDENGNLKSRNNELVTNGLTSYGYDAFNRLDSANGPFGSREYSYDKNDNRKSITKDGQLTEYLYNSSLTNSNKLDFVGTDDVNLDGYGSTIQFGTNTFVYTPYRQIREFYDNGILQASYSHNALGQRIKKILSTGQITNYQYSLSGLLLAEMDGVSNVIGEYIYLNGQPLAYITGGAVYYIHNDHLGTPKSLTNINGAVVWNAIHDPFGKANINADVDGDGKSIDFNVRFAGQYYDKESGLHYNYFRDYDPSTGRYVQSDPIGLGGGVNTYGYVGGNPLKWIDQFGLLATDVFTNDNVFPSVSRSPVPRQSPTRIILEPLTPNTWQGPSKEADGTSPPAYQDIYKYDTEKNIWIEEGELWGRWWDSQDIDENTRDLLDDIRQRELERGCLKKDG